MTLEFLVYDADLIASALRSKATWMRGDTAHDPEDVVKLQAAADRFDAYADTIDEYLAELDRHGAKS